MAWGDGRAAHALALLALHFVTSRHISPHLATSSPHLFFGTRRRPQFVRDWKPVWEQYQRYQALRMRLSDDRGVVELNGGEAASVTFV